MAIKIEHNGSFITVDTPAEAAELLEILRMKEALAEAKAKEAQAKAFIERKQSRFQADMKMFDHKLGAYKEENFAWTPDYFTALIDRLGKPQLLALALLVTKKSLADEELRNALNVSGNQALAGVLSGISKQAVALYIPARAIFDFENSRAGGKRRSDYLVTDEFRQIATQMNWPPQSLQPRSHS
jgi:hypothetical protein